MWLYLWKPTLEVNVLCQWRPEESIQRSRIWCAHIWELLSTAFPHTHIIFVRETNVQQSSLLLKICYIYNEDSTVYAPESQILFMTYALRICFYSGHQWSWSQFSLIATRVLRERRSLKGSRPPKMQWQANCSGATVTIESKICSWCL